jgi:PAS domain S-box-containing protein
MSSRPTDPAQAEERLRSIVNHVVDGIISIDERGVITTFNPAAERIFGYQAAEVVGQNVRILMPEPDRGEHDTYIQNYLRTGQAKIIGIGRAVVGRRKDGSTFPMELAISVFRLGGERHFTGIVRDITERRRMEQELEQRLAELAENDRQKNEFLAMLAHELRNPLAPLRNGLHLLNMQDVSEQVHRSALDIMGRQLHQLIRLVDDLLDVSRIIQGKIELRRQLVDVSKVIERAAETAQPGIDARGQTLEMEFPPQPLWVDVDPIRLAQVVANLLNNAAKYSPDQSSIFIKVSGDNGHAVLSVRDQGVGISADVLPHVFDLFVQADASLARTEGGLGVGLTLVKRLVEMHDGEVGATSAGLGQGSEFTIRLPASAAQPDASPIRGEALGPAASGAAGLRGTAAVRQ